MVVFLFRLIFLAVSALSNLVTWLILSVAAHLFVLIIQGLKAPGEAAKGGLEQISDALKSWMEYVLELMMEFITSLISSIFNLILEGLTSSAAVTGSAVGGLLEKTKESLDGLLNDVPEIAQAFSGMVSTVVSDLWNNFQEAIGYVKENA